MIHSVRTCFFTQLYNIKVEIQWHIEFIILFFFIFGVHASHALPEIFAETMISFILRIFPHTGAYMLCRYYFYSSISINTNSIAFRRRHLCKILHTSSVTNTFEVTLLKKKILSTIFYRILFFNSIILLNSFDNKYSCYSIIIRKKSKFSLNWYYLINRRRWP